jgi:HPt (histidine-containing phosphotransfer) domain-containing protein
MIDWQRVETLREEVGPEDFAEVVELFLEEVDEVMRRLAAAPDPARLGDDLHFVKGSALNLGFAELGALCQAAELRVAEGRADEVPLAAILDCYALSRQLFLETAAPRAVA